jgi:hypothetical protein
VASHAERKAKHAIVEERRAQVAKYLLARKSYREIAALVGVSLSQIGQDAKVIMARWRAEQCETISELKELELQANATAIAAVWACVELGYYFYITIYTILAEQHHKILGIYKEQLDMNLEGRIVRLPSKAPSLDEWNAQYARGLGTPTETTPHDYSQARKY